jgi:integrase
MRKALTDRGLKALAAKAATGKQFTIWDATLPGFGARVSAGGKIAFVVMRRPAGKPRPVRVTLGHYPAMTLEAARKAAQDALAELVQGKDPTEERQRRLAEKAEADATTFAGVAKKYKEHIADRRTIKQIKRTIDRDLVSRWDGRPIASITRKEVMVMVDAIRNAAGKRGGQKVGGPAAARQALTYAKRIFRYALARDLLDHSPADAISGEELLGTRKPRQRVLTDEELRRILTAFPWNTSDDVEDHERGRWPIAPILWLLTLLGIRRGELTSASATWNNVDLKRARLHIPTSKSGHPILVPLPTLAVRIFETLPRFLGNLVFTTGTTPIGAWSTMKTEVDHRSGVTGWVFHDLRRTARSGWSALGIAPHLCEMMLGHRQPGIIPTYDVHRYESERRDALEKWAQRIDEIVAPPPPESDKVEPPESGKVVKLRA